MELTHDFTVPAPIDTTWATFRDLHRVGSCFPGAVVTDPPYIQFTRETLFGQEYYQWAPCSGPGTCETTSPMSAGSDQ